MSSFLRSLSKRFGVPAGTKLTSATEDRDGLGHEAAQLRVVELDREPESACGLLLEQLEQVDRLPERPGDVPDVVVRVRALERGEGPGSAQRSRRRPSSSTSTRRIDRARVPGHERRRLRLHRPVEELDRAVHLATAEEPRRPDRARPEVRRELVERHAPPGASTARPTSSSASARRARARFGVFTLRTSRSSTSSAVGFTPRSESSPCGDARLELAGASPSRTRRGAAPSAGRPRASSSSRRSSGVTSGQSTGARRTLVRRRAEPGDHPERPARARRTPSSRTGNGSASPSASLPTARTSSHVSPSTRQPRSASDSPAKRRECLRRAEPLRRAADEEDARRGYDDPPRLRVDGRPALPHPAAERDAAVGRELDCERGRRADRDEHGAAGDRSLLHQLEGQPPADAKNVLREREETGEERPADDLVDRVVTADVLAHAQELALRVEEARRVQTARRSERSLRLEQPLGKRRRRARRESSSSLSTRGAATSTASIAPFPQTPHEDEV